MSGSPGEPASEGNRQLCPASASASKAERSKGSSLINQLHPRPGPAALPSPLCSLKPSTSRGHPTTTALQQPWVGSIPRPFLPRPVRCRAEARFPPQDTWVAPCRCLLKVTLVEWRGRGCWRSCVFWMETPNAPASRSDVTLASY